MKIARGRASSEHPAGPSQGQIVQLSVSFDGLPSSSYAPKSSGLMREASEAARAASEFSLLDVR